MNWIPTLLIYFTIIAMTYGSSEEYEMTVKEVAESLMLFAENCDPKPEEEHIIEVVKNVEDAQYISKCFRRCLMLQFDMIEQGSFVMNKDNVVSMMSTMLSVRKDDIDEIVEDCNNKNQGITEKCENAHAHGMCLLSQMKERGIDIPELKDE